MKSNIESKATSKSKSISLPADLRRRWPPSPRRSRGRSSRSHRPRMPRARSTKTRVAAHVWRARQA
eukprot:6501643-Alexandrium_andersonii.AAC.1